MTMKLEDVVRLKIRTINSKPTRHESVGDVVRIVKRVLEIVIRTD